MAAQNTDKLRKVARKWVGQVGAGGVENGTITTVPLASTANLPTETAIMITIDRVDANGVLTPDKEEGIIGVVSGDNLISCLRGVEGTAQAHSAGAVVEVLWTAKNVNDIVDAILAEHSQSGAHTTDTISEKTEDAGVTVDSLLIKDGRIAGWDGWMPAEETWTYASANTFTISGDKTGKYQKGDKIKLTNSTVKYFYVIGVSYSDPNTTVTVTGGSDYALASGTITNNYYSKIENPQGFPRINVTPSAYSGDGSMTYTSVTKDYCYLRITGSICEIIFAFMGTTGGTPSANIIISFASGTIPTPARNQWDGDVQYTDDVLAGCGNSVILTSRDLHVRKYNYSNWGIGGDKRITGIQTYYF